MTPSRRPICIAQVKLKHGSKELTISTLYNSLSQEMLTLEMSVFFADLKKTLFFSSFTYLIYTEIYLTSRLLMLKIYTYDQLRKIVYFYHISHRVIILRQLWVNFHETEKLIKNKLKTFCYSSAKQM